jgi:sugar fermentation stimulation protein A
LKFPKPLVPGKLIRRYKRFLADVELDGGITVMVHCTNSGSMKSCLEKGAPVYLSPSDVPTRKTKFTWEMIRINGTWVGVNTMVPNILAFEAIVNNQIEKLSGYTKVFREVKYGNSRIDLMAEKEQEKCYIEVKNVTYKDGIFARFPDAVTSRGLKHLETLMEIKKSGVRAVMLYVIQRSDVSVFVTARDIDPIYSQALVKAHQEGVEIIPIMANISPNEIIIGDEIPYDLSFHKS